MPSWPFFRYMSDPRSTIVALVKAAIDEDIAAGDLTSLACLEGDEVTGRIVGKSSGILSGLNPALLAFDIVDSANCLKSVLSDGDSFDKGDIVMEFEGFDQTILATERTAVNFLAHLSGIASLTGQYVQAVKGTPCVVLDTRKTTPGWRMLEKEAVVHGGGQNHRMGLYDMILIKENHIAAAGSIRAAVERARGFLSTADFRLQFNRTAEEIKIEVEVTSVDQITEAIDAGVKLLLIDNQSIESLAGLVRHARQLGSTVKLEASGNITLGNAAEVAATGVDFISIGSLTHSAPASDFSLLIDEPRA